MLFALVQLVIGKSDIERIGQKFFGIAFVTEFWWFMADMRILEYAVNTFIDIFFAETKGFNRLAHQSLFHLVQIAVGRHDEQQATKIFTAFPNIELCRDGMCFHKFFQYTSPAYILARNIALYFCAAHMRCLRCAV